MKFGWDWEPAKLGWASWRWFAEAPGTYRRKEKDASFLRVTIF
jgi:hypothetical protein